MNESCPGVVLIVDNDTHQVAGLRGELGAAGYVVLEATDSVTALQQLNSHHVDVVISELKLPNGDGLQMLDGIRRASPDTRVIFASSNGTIDQAVTAIKRGASDFVTRPTSPTAIVQKIREVCSSRVAGNGHEGVLASSTRDIESPMSRMLAYGAMPAARDAADLTGGLTEMMEGLERSLIEGALKRAAGNQAKAAQFLRIPRTTLRDKMAKYGMVGDTTRRQVAS